MVAQAPHMIAPLNPDLLPGEPGQGTSVIHDLVVDKFVKESVDIFPEAITEELTKMPAAIAYFNARLSDATRAYRRKEREVSELKARKRMHYRATLGKVTVDAVNDAVETDEEYVAAQVELFELEAAQGRAKAWSLAVGAKRDALMSLGGILRDAGEFRGDPQIRRLSEQAQAVHNNPFMPRVGGG